MEALDPKNNNNEASAPAEQAGIFLIAYDLLDPRSNKVQEAAAKIAELEKAGRYAGVIAIPGMVTIAAFSAER